MSVQKSQESYSDNGQDKRQSIDKNKCLLPTSKAELHGRKLMLSVWWDHHGNIHYEFLNHNPALNADLYFQELQSVY